MPQLTLADIYNLRQLATNLETNKISTLRTRKHWAAVLRDIANSVQKTSRNQKENDHDRR